MRDTLKNRPLNRRASAPSLRRLSGILSAPIVLLFAASTLLGFLDSHAYGGEQAGPNPANLTPNGAQGVSLFTGAFTYSYPIVAPPGRRGIQPNLALRYNSQAQNGWVGLGWNLSLGSIRRSTKNGIPTYNDGLDTFILQFQGETDQLVAVSTGSDGSGPYTEYRAQLESSFLRSRYYPPALWIVTSKNGTQYQMTGLGLNTRNSQYFYWGLTKEIDPLGNFMLVSYPSLSSATSSGTPGPGGAPTAIIGDGAIVGYMPGSISYTGKCASSACQTVSLSTSNQITFSYETRPDTMTFSMEGVEEIISTRLRSISATSNGTAVRTYQLTYSSSNIGSSMLAGVSLIGNDGITTLSTATFLYQSNSNYTVTLSTSYTLPVDITMASFADVNGDGLPDIVWYQSGVGSGTWLNTGNGWASSSTWISPVALLNSSGLDEGVRFGDINGDGRDDIVQGKGATYKAWLNNGNGWGVAASQWNPPVDIVDGSNVSSGTVLVDINGDGLPDIYQGVATNNGLNWALDAWINSGNGWVISSTWVPPSYLYYVGIGDRGTRFADLNGDGLIDLVGEDLNGVVGAWINNGHGWAKADAWYTLAFSPFNTAGGASFVDINGDGFPDIVQYVFYSTGSTVRVWLNTGSGGPEPWWNAGSAWLEKDSVGAALSSLSANSTLMYADLNGDGVVDVIALSTNPASDQVYLGHIAPSNLLTTVNNGLGGVTQISYGFSPPPAQPGLHLPPITVVQSVTTSDGMSGAAVMTSSYAYAGGLFDNSRPYREFLGFSQVTSTNAAGNYAVTDFFQAQNSTNGVNVFKGMISEQDRYDSSGNLQTRSTYTVSYSTPFAGVYFPIVAEADTTIGSKQSAVGYVYDSSGNLKQEVDYGDVSTAGDERTIATAYSASTGPYLVGYPTLKQIFSGVGTGGTLLAETSFYYDSSYTQSPTLGLLTKVDSFLSGGQDPVVISSFDAYGNATDTYDALYNATSGAQGNHVHLTYDTTAYQFPQSIQQAVGSSVTIPAETFVYDPGTGQMLSHVDVNGSTTSYSYDIYGRLATVIGPADQVTPSSATAVYQYNISTAPPQSIVSTARVIHGSTQTLTTYVFFDGLGRKIETKTAGPAATQIISDAVSFNNLGLAATSYMPVSRFSSSAYVSFSTTQPHAVTSYDGLSRAVQVVNPDNTVSTRAYQGWSETDTDANGHAKTYVKNAYGKVVEVDEIYSTSTYVTTYKYDLLGNLINIVNSLSQTTTIYYDTLSRKTQMNDPQMGTWQYVYDPNGNLLQQTDAKNQVITMTYDALNRRTFKIYPDSTTISFSYDSGTFAEGKLSQVIDLSGSQQFTYDSVGNVLSKTRTLGGKVYVTSMTYDALGRETSLTYPDGVTVNESYDASVLSVVQSTTGATLATLSYSTNAPAKISNVLYGNGMNAQYAYDPNMFRLTNLKALAAGATIQNFSYQYDNVGNITQITDAVGPMTQLFNYDPLDRISQASGTYGTNVYQYDSIGNLTLNSDNSGGFWGFTDLSALSSIQGQVTSVAGRVGNGVSFGGSGQATISGSGTASPPATMTLAVWVRPTALGSGYVVSKSSSYFFPQIESNGSVDAKLELTSGEQIVNVSSAPLYNLWNYFVMTYDGAAIKIYVNGQLWKSQAATGTINTSTQPIVLGTNFAGTLDELSVYPYALSAGQILQRYQLYPTFAPSQPFTPNSVPGGMTAGVVNTTYTFTFTAWDLNGNNLDYRVDWGTGTYQDMGYVPSGAVVQATHTWTSTGTYSVRALAVEPSTTSVWSPNCNILIVSTSIQTAMDASILIGASANVATLSGTSRTLSNTAGEPLVGTSSSTQTIGYQGYQGTTTAPSSWSPQYLGQQSAGGTDAAQPPELPARNLLTVSFSTSVVDISTIALNLLEHGATTLADANGNLQVENGRWILYDFENRPVRIVTQDAALLQFAYDFEGSRTSQTVAQLAQSGQTTTYVGGIYEVSGSSAMKYIAAGSLRIAMLDSMGTTTYFLPDHLGSTNLLVNNALSTVRTTQYMPFGSTFQTSGTTDNDHKYTGQRLDANSGLYYYRARYFDPTAGRFITPDAIVQAVYDPQTLNRYEYVRNNPLIYTDPTGNSFFGDIGKSLGDLGKDVDKLYKQTVKNYSGVIFFGTMGLVPQINTFSYRNRYYIAAAAITAATAGEAAPAIGAALSGTGASIGLAGSIEIGALAGEITGGVSAGLHGGSGKAILSSTIEQGALGAATSAISYGIVNGVATEVAHSVVGGSGLASKGIQLVADLSLIGSLGGVKGVLFQHQSFLQGFEGGVSGAVIPFGVDYELGYHPLISIPHAESVFGTVWPNTSIDPSVNAPIDGGNLY